MGLSRRVHIWARQRQRQRRVQRRQRCRMNGAMAEALAQADGEDDVEKKIEAALACPCLGELRRPHWCLPFARRTIRLICFCCWERCPGLPPPHSCRCTRRSRRRPEGGRVWSHLCARLWLLHPQRARGQGHGLPGAVQGLPGGGAGVGAGMAGWCRGWRAGLAGGAGGSGNSLRGTLALRGWVDL